MSTRLPASNFSLIHKSYPTLIMSVEDYDQTGRPSTWRTSRKTFLLYDGSKLYVTEHLDDGIIDFYQYDWVDASGEVKLKVHSEPHDELSYRTATEPFHIHTRAGDRLPNPQFQDLMSLVGFIHTYYLVG